MNNSSDCLWHYCSIDTLFLILKSGKILFNDVTNLGDSEEVNLAKREFLSLLQKDISAMIKVGDDDSRDFMEVMSSKDIVDKLSSEKICWTFCMANSDNIDFHWDLHADDGKGAAIGFSPYALSNSVTSYSELRKIIYDQKLINKKLLEKFDKVKLLVKRAYNKYASIKRSLPESVEVSQEALDSITLECYSKIINLILPVFVSFKGEHFSEEKETRLIITAPNLKNYLNSRGVFLYKEEEMKKKWLLPFSVKDSVKAITLGTNCIYDEATFKIELKRFLSDEIISKITIKKHSGNEDSN
jgi:hypothetical protein